MTTDGGLRQLFHARLREGIHWQAIETGGTGRGIPDSNYCCGGVEGWVEYKQTSAWSVGMRPEQVGWHLTRAQRGGRTFVAVRRQHDGGVRRGAAVDELWLFQGTAVSSLARSGLLSDDGLLGRWSGGPSQWDWVQVRDLLISDR